MIRHKSFHNEPPSLKDYHQKTKIIREADVYRLAMHSTLPSAERFQDWICEEVLPSIRKTGSYSLPEMTFIREPDLLQKALPEVIATKALAELATMDAARDRAYLLNLSNPGRGYHTLKEVSMLR